MCARYPCNVAVTFMSYFSPMVIKGTLCFIKPPQIGTFKEILQQPYTKASILITKKENLLRRQQACIGYHL